MSGMTLVKAWSAARQRLEAAGVDGPVIDARLLLEAAAGATRTDIITDPHRELTAEQAGVLEDFLARRERREPVSHILGRKGFWKIMLRVTPDVLTPRPDTETILDVVLKEVGEHQRFNLLDLGVGSGAILLAILAERPLGRGLGVDVSDEALAVARENAANLGLEARTALLHGDWTAGLADESFDVVVSNPPYIPSGDIAGLEPEVSRHEPRLALDGGPDGLEAYRILAPEVLRVLRPGGLFAVEIGADQKAAVEALFRAAGAEAVHTVQDLGARDRVVAGRKKALGKGTQDR
ncbi:MAG TPA: peptide chain release factor N(5)-glutamine methyltransferase [Caulobacteraceae bacterium]|nr:peptide chain release factor N(5)-glutamine methyltransferase [Caulobacteraceae bacterium]